MKPLVIGVGSVLLAIVLILLLSGPERAGDRREEGPGPGDPSPETRTPAAAPSPSAPDGAKPVTLLPVAQTTTRLHDAESSPDEDLLVISALLDQFRRHHGGNPIGDNDDIMAALRGGNAKSLAYLPTDHPALDPEGQLLDRWGTPYRFHALSGKHMQIRSAGPDREFWSDDDLVHDP